MVYGLGGNQPSRLQKQRKGRHKALSIPTPPSREEEERHEVSHIPFRSWCTACVRGKAKQMPCRRLPKDRDDGIPVVALDYCSMHSRESAVIT